MLVAGGVLGGLHAPQSDRHGAHRPEAHLRGGARGLPVPGSGRRRARVLHHPGVLPGE